jgi:hypothetical protein
MDQHHFHIPLPNTKSSKVFPKRHNSRVIKTGATFLSGTYIQTDYQNFEIKGSVQ